MDTLNCHQIEPAVIITDTEPTNTGHRNGVITRLKKEFPELVFEPHRLHVLDLILKHEFSARFADKTTSSELPYSFVKDASQNRNKKQDEYLSLCSISRRNHYADLPSIESRRKDYQFLLKLVRSV